MNNVEKFLRTHGPSLSSDITDHFVNSQGITRDAARQQVSRQGKNILKLDLSFPRRAKFFYLQEQSGSGLFWRKLIQSLIDTNSAYGYALSAIETRGGIVPRSHFEIICGSPVKQKKHLAASVVLQRLLDTNLLKVIDVKGIGECLFLGIHINHISTLFPQLKARLLSEDILIKAFSEWLRKTGFVSYQKLSYRSDTKNPLVSTTAWDIAGPSYLHPLISQASDSDHVKPGFVTCDLLLTDEVGIDAIRPFLQKVASLRSLKNVGRQLTFFIANQFSPQAFSSLKQRGISPATVDNLFGTDIRAGLKELIDLLTVAAFESVDPEKLSKVFKSLGKIEGAANRLRGAFFEYIIAEALREESSEILLNQVCLTQRGKKEADVISISKKQITFVEGKGYNQLKKVTKEEVDYWLNEQVPVFRDFVNNHPTWNSKHLTFEFWTTGSFTNEALERLNQASDNTFKYKILFRDQRSLTNLINETKNKSLIKTFSDHFCSPFFSFERG